MPTQKFAVPRLARAYGSTTTTDLLEVVPGLDMSGHTIYDCLVGDVFNRYWENGVDGYG